MKNLHSCFIFFPLLALVVFVSCNDDLQTESQGDPSPIGYHKNDVSSINASNPANPYDSAGQIHNEISDSYFDGSALPTTITGVLARVDDIAQSNSHFVGLKDPTYELPTAQHLSEMLNNPASGAAQAYNASNISPSAKTSLEGFTRSLLGITQGGTDYKLIFNYISDYESLVISHSAFSAHDKKVLLTVTSIARHAAARKKRPKPNTDTDWEINIFHIVGGIDGIPHGTASSITSAVCLGIAGNL